MKLNRLKISLFAIGLLGLSSCIREDATPVEVPSMDGVVSPNVGGATYPNQVWIDLSENKQTINERHAWDLAFSNDNSNRVLLNNSIMMAVGQIPHTTDIDAVTEASVASLKDHVRAGFASPDYIDDPTGNYETQTTGMKAVSAIDSENPVYLLNLGTTLCTGNVSIGGTCTGDQERGWMKIRIFLHPKGYKIQYAKLNETTHKEMIVEKTDKHHFVHISLTNGQKVSVQPEKKKWDLVYTVLTNTTGEPPMSYVFADMVLINTKSNVGAYMVKVPAGQTVDDAYDKFTKSSVDATKFDSNDQRAIGSQWRGIIPGTSSGASVYTDRFFIVRDADGMYYKLKFLGMTNSEGTRGFPKFDYRLL